MASLLVNQFLLLAADPLKGDMDFSQTLAMVVPLIAIVIGFYFMVVVPQNRDSAKRQALLKGLQKNDKVITIGGILGTVANVSPDGDVITLKLADNVRVDFIRSAIQRVVSDDDKKTDKPNT